MSQRQGISPFSLPGEKKLKNAKEQHREGRSAAWPLCTPELYMTGDRASSDANTLDLLRAGCCPCYSWPGWKFNTGHLLHAMHLFSLHLLSRSKQGDKKRSENALHVFAMLEHSCSCWPFSSVWASSLWRLTCVELTHVVQHNGDIYPLNKATWLKQISVPLHQSYWPSLSYGVKGQSNIIDHHRVTLPCISVLFLYMEQWGWFSDSAKAYRHRGTAEPRWPQTSNNSLMDDWIAWWCHWPLSSHWAGWWCSSSMAKPCLAVQKVMM